MALTAAALLWTTLVLLLGQSQGCGITTHTEIGQRALYLLSTHSNPAIDTIR
jgi:hypothetical protein